MPGVQQRTRAAAVRAEGAIAQGRPAHGLFGLDPIPWPAKRFAGSRSIIHSASARIRASSSARIRASSSARIRASSSAGSGMMAGPDRYAVESLVNQTATEMRMDAAEPGVVAGRTPSAMTRLNAGIAIAHLATAPCLDAANHDVAALRATHASSPRLESFGCCRHVVDAHRVSGRGGKPHRVH
ncbi:MAG: hypothetical protein ACREUX_13690 [Burkholderiales bacterium]